MNQEPRDMYKKRELKVALKLPSFGLPFQLKLITLHADKASLFEK